MMYFFVLVLVNLMWAFLYSGAKIATGKLGPITVALVPMAIATVLLVPIVVLTRRRAARKVSAPRPGLGRCFLQFLVLGTCGTVLAQLSLAAGVKLSLASNASIITLTLPLLNALLAAILLGERMNRILWLSFVLALVGVLLVSDIDWRSVEIFRGRYLAGNALILAGCCGSAFYNAYGKRLLRAFTPPEVLLYAFLVSDVVLLVLMLLREPVSAQRMASLGVSVWLSLALMGILSHVVAMMLFLWVIQRIPLTQASLSIYLLPVFGVLISALAVHERITWQLLAGGLLVFIGAFLATTYAERRKAQMALAAKA